MLEKFVQQLNDWGSRGQAFLFVIDYEQKKPLAYKLDELPPDIYYDIHGRTNYLKNKKEYKKIVLRPQAVSFDTYQAAFDQVKKEILFGNSYLLNLSFGSQIKMDAELEDVFVTARAKYKLLLQNQCVVFSPEAFIKIKNKKIYAYPMKGTIDANIPNAEAKILNDPKELAEHCTIVDLLRNDLSMVSSGVRLHRFRYIDHIQTSERNLLQVSSEIVGDLEDDYEDHIGDIIGRLLPAGSISGAPKKKTIEIIRAAEGEDRGYYTGVFGIFDGSQLDSAVMIRYIEQNTDGYIYRSGGGITHMSDCTDEYQELLQKIYVPTG